MPEHDGPAPPPHTDTARVALLVVGGGPAAVAAVRGYRDHGGTGRVLLVSDDDAPPYLRPPLSKDFLRGETAETDLPLEPEGFYAERDVGVRLGTMVTSLHADDRRAVTSDGEEITFGHCVLATGSAPAELPVPGADDPRVHHLRSLDEARRLRDAAQRGRSAVVVGSGFIGCEAAVSLARRGLRVTVCSTEELPQADRLGEGAGRRIAGWLRTEGVVVRGGVTVTGIEAGRTVHLRDGGPVQADLVLVAAGAAPRITLGVAAGLAVEQDRIVVDERMRSSVPALLAAGDIAFARNAAAGRHLAVEHWGDAEAMGAVAGATAAGADATWADPPGFWTVVGDRVLKYTAWGDGFDRAELIDHGDDTFTVWYSHQGVLVGVATHDADEDFERGTELVRTGAQLTH